MKICLGTTLHNDFSLTLPLKYGPEISFELIEHLEIGWGKQYRNFLKVGTNKCDLTYCLVRLLYYYAVGNTREKRLGILAFV